MGIPAQQHNALTTIPERLFQQPSVAAHDKTQLCLGRHVFGLAAVGFAIVSFVWHDLGAPWQQTRVFGNFPYRDVVVYIVATVELFGGMAVQWPRTARAGALTLGSIFLMFALLWVPHIIAEPLKYDRWGNFFEQFSLVSGALIVYAAGDRDTQRGAKTARLGYYFFGICVVSFTLEQLFYLSGTAGFVPEWIPPGQMFWAVTTTIAFALAAVALLSGRLALLASRLTTAMIIGFGLLVWLPRPFASPHALINWAGNAQNLAIAGAAWIVADFLNGASVVATTAGSPRD